jgi:hypothetical protein
MDKLCVFRDWRPTEAPAGAVTFSVLSKVLSEKEGLGEDEVGEIFFELDAENKGFVCETEFDKGFEQVAGKYAAGKCGGKGCSCTIRMKNAVLSLARRSLGGLLEAGPDRAQAAA